MIIPSEIFLIVGLALGVVIFYYGLRLGIKISYKVKQGLPLSDKEPTELPDEQEETGFMEDEI